MDILIHTHGRPQQHRQHTLRALKAEGLFVKLVVQANERKAYEGWGFPLVVLPEQIRRLAPTRDWIIHDMVSDHDKVVFLDDDLDFAVRRPENRTLFRQPKPGDLTEMFGEISRQLQVYPMVGIGAREGGNRLPEMYLENTRIMRVLAFRRSYLKKKLITFSPLTVMEDFHVNLQILESGASTCVCNTWVSNQRNGSDASGGCSIYRTPDVQRESAEQLAARHPGFVKVVQKSTKSAWGGGTRTDVVIQWKRAAAWGLKRSLT